MKRLWISIIAALLAVGLVGCAHGEDNQGASDTQNTHSSQTASDTSDVPDDTTSKNSDSETDGPDSSNDGPDSDSTSSEDSSDTENPPSSGTVVPPITDGGNFDGTV